MDDVIQAVLAAEAEAKRLVQSAGAEADQLVADAQKRAYQAIGKIHFDGMHYRKDIGWRAVK
jgi:phosphoribosylamine--glycine ligase